MSAVATRRRASKLKPATIETPLEGVVSRIAFSRKLIGMALDSTQRGSHLWVVLVGLEEQLLPDALARLHGESVSKTDVDATYNKLMLPLSVLHAALVLADGLVMESTLQQAFEILDRAHSDMDSARVQHWPIPDHAAVTQTMPVDTPTTAPAGKLAAREFDEDDAWLVLLRASSISGFLMNIFGNESTTSPNEVRGLEGLMGSIQHLRRILHDLNETLEPCKDANFCALVVEASSLAALFDDVEWLSGYKFHRGDHQISCYFDAITKACDRAIALLSAEAVQP